MAEFRKYIKDYFKAGVNSILKEDESKEFAKFDIWNNQVQFEQNEDSVPRTVVYFEYLDIGETAYFARGENIKHTGTTPVDVALHLVTRNFSLYEPAFEEIWRLAWLLVKKFTNVRNDAMFNRIRKIGETQDVQHNSLIDWVIIFRCLVFEDAAKDQLDDFIGDDTDYKSTIVLDS